MNDLRNKLLSPKLVGGRPVFPLWVGALFVVFYIVVFVGGALK